MTPMPESIRLLRWMLCAAWLGLFTAHATAGQFFTASSPPPVTSGLVLHYDGTNVSTSGANVTSWNNQGSLGAAGNLTPPGTAPTLVIGGLNGENVVQFGGAAGEVLTSGAFATLTQPNTLFVVARNDGSNSPVILDGTSGAQRNFFRPTSGGGVHLYAGTSQTFGTGLDSSQFRISR